MRIFEKRVLVICSFFACASSFAATLTLPEAIEIVLQHSGEVQQSEHQWNSSVAKKHLALAPTEPNLTVTYNDLTKPLALGTVASKVIQVTQPLGFPGKALLNHSALADQAEAGHYQFKSTKLQVAFNVKQAYYALALALKNIQVNAAQKEDYEKIFATARRRYETGGITQVDYLNAEVALLSSKNDLADLKAAERQARAQLNVLLHRDVDEALEISEIEMIYRPTLDIKNASEQMLKNRNEIQSARHQLSAAEKTHKLAWMSVLPDFQLTVGTTFYNVHSASPLSSTPDATTKGTWPTHTYMAGVQLTMPLWFFFNERQVIKGASHDRAAAEANLDIVVNQSRVALETAVSIVNALREKIENYEKHMMPLSDQSFQLALVNYGSGKIDFQTLSDTANTRRGIKRDYYSAILNYLTNYAIYGQIIGEDLL